MKRIDKVKREIIIVNRKLAMTKGDEYIRNLKKQGDLKLRLFDLRLKNEVR
jgi:hypothetical protein